MIIGVMMALRIRDKTGIGQEIDISLFQTGVYHLSWELCGTIISGQNHENRLLRSKRDTPNPLLKTYRTKDDRWILLVCLVPDRYWSRFCQAIGREDLENDPLFNSTSARTRNSATLIHILEEIFLTKTLAEWKPILKGLPFDAVQNNIEVVNDPQAMANNFFVDYEHPIYGPIKVVANPINLSKTPASLRLPAPEFGQHSEEILIRLGYTWEDIVSFKEQGIIA